ncbi:hypothetical protein ZIOFF_046578 [Zingiber officinale]|uniref:Myb/SANT-like domain-containing protein n=1 Tax=Zingiber officinale TaxID=94328 RepID=A0A8J5KUV7_ZINOF|nr:hypothetical protein ZIOFF_046578 [Zingiber officinale]
MRWMCRLTMDCDSVCISQLRTDRATFRILCDMVVDIGGLKPTKNTSIEEVVAMFIYTLAHHKKSRTINLPFYRSIEIVSRQFHEVLNAILKLYHILLKKPKPITQDCQDEKWKCFQGCLGALDGTLIKVTPPTEDNLAIALEKGCYYLVDSGYCNANGFLVSYQGQQYHLKEFQGHRSETLEEYFNMKHSKARNFMSFEPRESLIADEEEESDREVTMKKRTTITPSIARGRGKNKQYWTDEEVGALVDALIELASNPLWKVDTGFKNGYMVQIHKMVLGKIPSFNKAIIPRIESKIKYLKTKYNPLSEMCMQSECQWDDVKHKINCAKQWFDAWCLDRAVRLGAKDVAGASMDANWQKNLSVSSSSDNKDEPVLDILSQGSPSRTRSACINPATLAIADAGIPMRDIVTSCSAGYLSSTPLLDLNYVDDSAGGLDVTVGIIVKMDKVSSSSGIIANRAFLDRSC